MANATRKEHHSYRLSYAQEVGSSIDPDLEDVASWEQELAGMYIISRKVSYLLQESQAQYLSCSFGLGQPPWYHYCCCYYHY